MNSITTKIIVSAIASTTLLTMPASAQSFNGVWQCAKQTSLGDSESASIKVEGNKFYAQVSHSHWGAYQGTGNVHFNPPTSELFLHGGNTSIPGPIVSYLVVLQNDRQGYSYNNSCQNGNGICIETRCQR